MGIFESMKKGLAVAGKSLLLCLIAMIILFVGYILIGFLLGASIIGSKFPPITPDMTPEQLNGLNWGQVNWGLFIPSTIIVFILGFLLNSFTQGGIIATLKDCVTKGEEKVMSFFGSAAKYCLKLFTQLILVVAVTILSVIIALVAMSLVAATKIAVIVIVVDIAIFLILMALLIYIAMVLVYGQISLIFNDSKAIKALGDSMKFIKKNLLKSVILFILTGIIYVAFYLIIRGLTLITLGWPIVTQVIWNLVTSYIYILVSMFMVGSFITFYSASKVEKVS